MLQGTFSKGVMSLGKTIHDRVQRRTSSLELPRRSSTSRLYLSSIMLHHHVQAQEVSYGCLLAFFHGYTLILKGCTLHGDAHGRRGTPLIMGLPLFLRKSYVLYFAESLCPRSRRSAEVGRRGNTMAVMCRKLFEVAERQA